MNRAQAEDRHGRFWWTSRGERARLCSDLECVIPVAVVRRPDGWWWEHDGEEAGPFEQWQEAADVVVAAGLVAVDARLDRG